MPTRRAFLRGLSYGTGAVAATAATTGTVAASHPDEQPDHVTIAYESSTLQTYQPLLDMSQESREKLIDLYGWVARSSELDTAVCVYWCSYTHQDAPFWAPSTSHWGDHEPIQVEFNTETGAVERVRASVYHWLKGEVPGEDAVLDGTNPTLKVIDPFHHYTAQPDAARCIEFDVADLTEVFDAWLANGLEEDLLPGACYNPWTMRQEADFWAPGRFGLPGPFDDVTVPNGDALRAEAAQAAGFGITGDLSG